jgi:hypothetical protein
MFMIHELIIPFLAKHCSGMAESVNNAEMNCGLAESMGGVKHV